MLPRKILHLDLDAFYCAVEELRDPTLKGRAFAVGGRPDQRGVVASCSYSARRLGVRSAMPMSQAVRLCPELLIVSAHFSEYHRVSAQVMMILNDLTPVVEQISIDEAFLDVSLLRDDAERIARGLQAQINRQCGLPASLGVASNKLVAKIANNLGKAGARGDLPPNAIKVIPPGTEAVFLASLPTRELWGVGPKTAEALARLGIHTIGDIARWPQGDLVRRFGKHGAELAERARGLDDRPVEPESESKSVSNETTFAQDIADSATLQRTLRTLSDKVGRRLRKDGLQGTTVKLKLRWSDFTTLTRQVTLPHATHHDEEIYQSVLDLFQRVWIVGRPVRLLGVGISGFEQEVRQLGLWEQPKVEAEQSSLESALDKLRDRFGDRVIQRGSDLLDEDL